MQVSDEQFGHQRNAMNCYSHPEKEAVGECALCGKPICPECTVEIDGKLYCKYCVAERLRNGQARTFVVRNRKNPGIATVLSFIFPGLGQMYCGNFPRGFIFMLLGVFSSLAFATLGKPGLLITFPVVAMAMRDAYDLAKRINAGENI